MERLSSRNHDNLAGEMEGESMIEEPKTNKEERKTIIVTQPEADIVSTVLVEPDVDVTIRADVAEATARRADTDLEFAFDDGGIIILKKYFAAIPEASLVIELPDGFLVKGDDLLLGASLDLTTGP